MGNVVMEATQINYRRDDTLKTVDQKLQELSQESAIDTDIAPVFKSNVTYHPGDLVYYRNKLYVFNVEHTGAWAVADVTATDVSGAMNAALAGKADYADIAGAFSAETAYTAGDLVIYNGIIYRCTNDHTGDWDADDFSATTIGAELNAINSNLANKEPLGGATTGNKTFAVGGNLELRTDGEGGNITIKSQNNVQFEIDGYTDTLRIWSQKSGVLAMVTWDGVTSVDLASINSKCWSYYAYGTSLTIPAGLCIGIMVTNPAVGGKTGFYTFAPNGELVTVVDCGITVTATLSGDSVVITTASDAGIMAFKP